MPKLSSRMLSHRVTVLRSTKTSDSQGGYTEALAPVIGQLACRLTDSKLANRLDESGALVADITRWLYAAPGTDIQADDRVDVGGAIWLVQSADDQPDRVYRKAFLLAEQ